MKYSVLAIDLDGTLLNDEKEIDARDREAIQSFRAKGGIVIIISGRTPSSTRWIAENLNLTEPIIAFNGAVIQQASGTYFDTFRFDNVEILRFIEICTLHDIYFHLYSGDTLLIPKETRWNQNWVEQNIPSLQHSGGDPERCQVYRDQCAVKRMKSIGEYVRLGQLEIAKIAVFHENKSLLPFATLLKKQFPSFEITSSLNYTNLEISPSGVTKGSSLAKLMNALGIPLQKVAAIGDNFNDVSMLETVGLGVAMGNAPEQVKARARVVTNTNQHAGVARAIYEFLLD
jgi:Cof subfamily protein (haloacid dehalogenase superfamily)